jgi:hypothetical protein
VWAGRYGLVAVSCVGSIARVALEALHRSDNSDATDSQGRNVRDFSEILASSFRRKIHTLDPLGLIFFACIVQGGLHTCGRRACSRCTTCRWLLPTDRHPGPEIAVSRRHSVPSRPLCSTGSTVEGPWSLPASHPAQRQRFCDSLQSRPLKLTLPAPI